MKRWLVRIVLVVLAVLIAVQIPFIYRRYRTGQLAERIAATNAAQNAAVNPQFNEYKGIIHAHTSLGGHSYGTFDELIAAANSNGLDFVIMTEHYSQRYDTSALTLNGFYGSTLFIGGNEVDTADSDRFLMIPGSGEAASFRTVPTSQFLERVHSEGRIAWITYPERFKSWDSNYGGIEVFSVHTDAKKANPFTAFFDLIWSYPAYPELTLTGYFRRPDINLQKFDETASQRKISLFGGTDAHSNIGFRMFADETGKSLISIKIDPYDRIFRLVRAHVLIEKEREFSQEALIASLKGGRFFVGFDSLGDSRGFSFTGNSPAGTVQMGGETSVGTQLTASAPAPARFVFMRNGEKIREAAGAFEAAVAADVPGAYRVEVYREDLGAGLAVVPWILSNPIYVR